MVATRTKVASAAALPGTPADVARRHVELLAGISHELRTPMHAILSYARLGEARAGQLSGERLQHYFSGIRASGEKLLALVNDLLDLSRMEAGGMRYQFDRHDLAKVVSEVAWEMEEIAAASSVAVAVDPPLEDACAWCDPVRVGQVLRNLLANAIRFSPPNTTVCVAFAETELPAGRRAGDTDTVPAIAIMVRDEGGGIPDDEIEPIFEKFVQGSAGKASGNGAGLGLSICREIANAHGGRIWAGNNAPGGATFTFALPRKAVPASRRGVPTAGSGP